MSIAILPPTPSGDPPGDFAAGPLEVRPSEMQVLIGDRRVGLTVREFQVFYVLARVSDRVVPRPDLFDQVWGGRLADRDRSVDVCVNKVRRKLDLAAPQWVFIHTHFGIGYRFHPEPRLPVLPAVWMERAQL